MVPRAPTDSPVPAKTRCETRDSTFEQFLEFVPDAIVGVGRDGEIVLVNRQAEALFGYDARRADRRGGRDCSCPSASARSTPATATTTSSEPRTRPMGAGVELFAVRKDGTEFPVEISLSSIETRRRRRSPPRRSATSASGPRASARRRCRSSCDRARRLESVGQLAGGIAHDFNNILGVIMNYAEFVADELEPDSQAHEDVEEIRRAAERAAALTRQLLIFSRREVVKPEVLDLRRADRRAGEPAAPGARRAGRAGDPLRRRTWWRSKPIPARSSRCWSTSRSTPATRCPTAGAC